MQDWLTLDRRPTLVFGAGGLGGASALSLAACGGGPAPPHRVRAERRR